MPQLPQLPDFSALTDKDGKVTGFTITDGIVPSKLPVPFMERLDGLRSLTRFMWNPATFRVARRVHEPLLIDELDAYVDGLNEPLGSLLTEENMEPGDVYRQTGGGPYVLALLHDARLSARVVNHDDAIRQTIVYTITCKRADFRSIEYVLNIVRALGSSSHVIYDDSLS